ncbi:ferrichrome ABC transporter permease [Clostridium zeae]|uniref:Ferrichrome ABC transporter permease n=1 Tax=Clostridium zeae TaxID=2759022 RepID=A0ABQ1EB80_9CLOT|nr:iron ABC transporter permease [Clostridium zeae]GFZ32060.1 ferrichrome ABC transporter permease [Clostridium zeae]
MILAEKGNEENKKSRIVVASLIVVIGAAVLLFGIGLSMSLGAKHISLDTVFNSIFYSKDNVDNQIIRDLRMPRAIAAALVGGFLAVSGAVMQGITRNPIAEPSIMGITQGATFTIAIAFSMQLNIGSFGLMIFAFAGASISGILVYFLSSRSIKGTDPVKLALAGTAIGTLLISLATAIAMYFNLSQQLSFWIAGGLTTAKWQGVKLLGMVGLVGVVFAIILSPKITILSLGEEIAIGLGQKTNLIRFIGIVIVIMLCGASVSVAGNVAFVGLIVPQIVKGLVGPDYRYIIPCSLVVGAALVVYCDIAARMINQPYETPIGSLIALIGVPFFIYLVRKGDKL